ncbi:hypothetical protein HYV81_02310 [Candidatus Woesearchaeota archaeon]|nr:hypothetical protein [Candidatus Woesearchaeota archaeon]
MQRSHLPINVRDILSQALAKKSLSIYDLHTHVESADLREPIKRSKYRAIIHERGLTAVVQTDHNSPPFNFKSRLFIPGIEIGSIQGHINLMGINERYKKLIEEHYPLEEPSRPTLKRKAISADQILFDLHEWYGNSPDLPIDVLPHPFQKGGIFYNKDPIEVIQAFKRKRVPHAEDRTYFIEWTNGYHKSPYCANAERVLEIAQKKQFDFVLVAGSDSHRSESLGLAGIVVTPGGNSYSFERAKQALRNRQHLVYHLSIDPDNPDYITLTLTTARGTDRRDFQFVAERTA